MKLDRKPLLEIVAWGERSSPVKLLSFPGRRNTWALSWRRLGWFCFVEDVFLTGLFSSRKKNQKNNWLCWKTHYPAQIVLEKVVPFNLVKLFSTANWGHNSQRLLWQLFQSITCSGHLSKWTIWLNVVCLFEMRTFSMHSIAQQCNIEFIFIRRRRLGLFFRGRHSAGSTYCRWNRTLLSHPFIYNMQ